MNDWENVAYWEESEQSKALANNFGLSQTQLGSLEGSRSQGNFAISPLTRKQYFQHLNWHKIVIYLHVQKTIKIIKNLITRLEV